VVTSSNEQQRRQITFFSKINTRAARFTIRYRMSLTLDHFPANIQITLHRVGTCSDALYLLDQPDETPDKTMV
jgi:hypothetical protein